MKKKKDKQGKKHAPPIDGFAVALAQKHFGSQILGSAAKRRRSHRIVVQPLCKRQKHEKTVGTKKKRRTFGNSKICHENVALGSEQNVFGLHISINNAQTVQIPEKNKRK